MARSSVRFVHPFPSLSYFSFLFSFTRLFPAKSVSALEVFARSRWRTHIVLPRLINASTDSILHVIHVDCFVLQKNVKWTA